MRKMMSRAAVLTGIRQMEMRDIPIPEIGDEDGLLKVEMVGVCGSDPGFYNGKTKVPFPLIMDTRSWAASRRSARTRRR